MRSVLDYCTWRLWNVVAWVGVAIANIGISLMRSGNAGLDRHLAQLKGRVK